MRIAKSIIIVSLLCISSFSHAQFNSKNVIELNYGYGISNDFASRETYNTFFFGAIIEVEERSAARTRNIGLGYTRFINSKNGIKVSFGLAKYGFDLNGRTDVPDTPIRTTYRITYLEWGLSYLRRVALSNSLKLLIEPGLRYHSDGSPSSNAISLFRSDSFSFSWYSGIEMPMIGNNFHTNIGLQLKIPLEKYNGSYDMQPGFYPYFIGIKFGVNFQFSSF